jgi:hypothetical protein
MLQKAWLAVPANSRNEYVARDVWRYATTMSINSRRLVTAVGRNSSGIACYKSNCASADKQMVEAFTRAGKPYDLMVLPEQRRLSETPTSYSFSLNAIGRYFQENLKCADCRPFAFRTRSLRKKEDND